MSLQGQALIMMMSSSFILIMKIRHILLQKKHYRGRKEDNSSLVAVILTTYVSFHDTMLLLLTLDSFSAYVHITKADKRSTYYKDQDLFRPHVLNNNETIYTYVHQNIQLESFETLIKK